MKKIIIMVSIIISCLSIYGQQEPTFSQYMFNGLFINPAYAGSNDYVSTNIIARNQWVTYPGQPKTLTFSMDTKIPTENMGLGLTFASDMIGVSQTNEIGLNYSYFVKTSKNTRLSFGLKCSMLNYTDKLTDLTIWDEDQTFSSDLSYWFPKFGFGMYFYSKNYYIGLSVPTLYVYDKHYNFNVDINESSFYRRHFYLTAGYVFDLGDKYKLKASTLVKGTSGAPIQADFNISGLYNDVFWLGLGYRINNSIMVMIAFQINDYMRLGYSYDVVNFGLFNETHGAHEIQLGIDFGGRTKRIKSVRYF